MNVGMIGSGMIANVFLNTFQDKSPILVKGIWCLEKYYDSTKEMGRQFNVDYVDCDMDAFFQSDRFDTVYLAVINSLHYEYALKALKAGKNVICEKPFTTTYAQAKELVDLAKEKGLFLFDCAPERYTENLDALKEAIVKIGDVKIVNFAYCQYSRRYDRYLEGEILPVFSLELAGGALYDLNIYCMSLIEDILGEPESYKYYPNKGYNGIDVSGVMMLDYGDTKAISYTAKDCAGQQQGFIQGTKGFIRIDGMPGNMQNMYLHLNGEEEAKIDTVEHEDTRAYMFLKMNEIKEAGDYEKAYAMLEHTLVTMRVMENARKQAGIFFGGNND
ncbi:MAG: Gfo/Idh/MocA family oxidoreductase [Erysipelotrichaceae bacterium]|nr:Gfo/Idh/MocA family oxidoreductase [Erysipelotrichaceae bacterium]